MKCSERKKGRPMGGEVGFVGYRIRLHRFVIKITFRVFNFLNPKYFFQ